MTSGHVPWAQVPSPPPKPDIDKSLDPRCSYAEMDMVRDIAREGRGQKEKRLHLQGAVNIGAKAGLADTW